MDISDGALFLDEKDFQDDADFSNFQKSLQLIKKKMKILEEEVTFNVMNLMALLNCVGWVNFNVKPKSIQNQIIRINK